MKVFKNHRFEVEDKPVGDKGSGEVNSGTEINETKWHNKHIGGIIYLAILIFSLFALIIPSYAKIKEINNSLDRINNVPQGQSMNVEIVE